VTIKVYKILKSVVHIEVNGNPTAYTKNDLEVLKKAIKIAEELNQEYEAHEKILEKRNEWERKEELYWKSCREKFRELSLPFEKLKDDIIEKLREGKLRGEKIQENALFEKALAKKRKWLETQTIESLVIIHEIGRAKLHELVTKLDKKYEFVDKSKGFGRFANIPEHPLIKCYLHITQEAERYRKSKLYDLLDKEVESAPILSGVQG